MRKSHLLAPLALFTISLGCSDGGTEASDGAAGTVATAGTGGSALPAAGSTSGGTSGGGSGGSASIAGSGGTTAGAGGTSAAGAPSGGGSMGGTPASAGSGGTGAGGAHVIDPSLPPGKNYDLSRWALQLPIANGNSVKQIVSPELETYTSEFFKTGADGAIVFWCPVTGATTENSHYPRSELRERPVGGDWAITGKHTLTASFKMLKNTPSKGTIIGQIHGNATGGTSEVLKLEWMSDNRIVASVEENNAPTKQKDQELGKYELGSLVSYTFKLENSVLDISVTDDAGTKTFSTPYTAASWKNDKYYFKLGSYVQLDSGGSTLGGEVAFYSFDVQHEP